MKSSLTFLLFALPILLFSQNQERLSVHYFDVPQELEVQKVEMLMKISCLIVL